MGGRGLPRGRVMPEEANPLDFDSGHVNCPRCGVTVPREFARLKVTDRLHNPPLNPISPLPLSVREMKWVCPACFKKLHDARRGASLMAVVIILVVALLGGLMFYFMELQGR